MASQFFGSRVIGVAEGGLIGVSEAVRGGRGDGEAGAAGRARERPPIRDMKSVVATAKVRNTDNSTQQQPEVQHRTNRMGQLEKRPKARHSGLCRSSASAGGRSGAGVESGNGGTAAFEGSRAAGGGLGAGANAEA